MAQDLLTPLSARWPVRRLSLESQFREASEVFDDSSGGSPLTVLDDNTADEFEWWLGKGVPRSRLERYKTLRLQQTASTWQEDGELASQFIVTSISPTNKNRVSAYYQGDIRMLSEEAIATRMEIKRDPRITRALTRFWERVPKDQSGRVTRDIYDWMHMKMFRMLFPATHVEQGELFLQEDWAEDSKGRDCMGQEQFFEAIFNTADMWVSTLEVKDYVNFINKCCRSVTSEMDYTPPVGSLSARSTRGAQTPRMKRRMSKANMLAQPVPKESAPQTPKKHADPKRFLENWLETVAKDEAAKGNEPVKKGGGLPSSRKGLGTSARKGREDKKDAEGATSHNASSATTDSASATVVNVPQPIKAVDIKPTSNRRPQTRGVTGLSDKSARAGASTSEVNATASDGYSTSESETESSIEAEHHLPPGVDSAGSPTPDYYFRPWNPPVEEIRLKNRDGKLANLLGDMDPLGITGCVGKGIGDVMALAATGRAPHRTAASVQYRRRLSPGKRKKRRRARTPDPPTAQKVVHGTGSLTPPAQWYSGVHELPPLPTRNQNMAMKDGDELLYAVDLMSSTGNVFSVGPSHTVALAICDVRPASAVQHLPVSRPGTPQSTEEFHEYLKGSRCASPLPMHSDSTHIDAQQLTLRGATLADIQQKRRKVPGRSRLLAALAPQPR